MFRLVAWVFSNPSFAAAIAVAAGLVVGAAYVKGRMDAGSNCNEKALLAQISTLQRDLDVSKNAAASAERLRRDAEAKSNTAQEEVDRYAKELAKRPDPACRNTQSDIDHWLRIDR